MSSIQTSAPGLKLVRAESQHVGEMGRICYEAFKDLHDRHHFPLDFPSAALARQLLDMLVSRSDFYSVVALLDGQVVGSNSCRSRIPWPASVRSQWSRANKERISGSP